MRAPTTSTSTLSIAAAITLSCASFSNSARALAGSPTNVATQTEPASHTTYPAQALAGLHSFVEVLREHQNFMPERACRVAVFSRLQREGALAAVPLNPLEQRALLLCAEYGAETVILSIFKATADIHQSKVDEDAIFKRIPARTPSPSGNSQEPTGEEYKKGLQMLHLLAGMHHLDQNSAAQGEAIQYLAQASPSHRSVLVATIGAGIMQPGLKPTSLAATLTADYLTSAHRKLSENDVRSLQHLPGIGPHKDNRKTRIAFVTVLTAAIYGLYARTRAHESNSEKHSTK